MKRLILPFWLFAFAFACCFAFGNSPEKTPAGEKKDSDSDLKELVRGNNEFAFDLYRRLSENEKGNLIFSPYSISTALGMTYGGARGETAAQMEKVLHFTLGQEKLHPAFGALMRQLPAEGPNPVYQLEVANAVWPQEGFGIKKEFQQLVATHYDGGTTPLDYQRDAEAARQTINRWVAERTQDRIKELLTSGDVTSNTRLFLTNTAYFKASWVQRFPESETKEEDFEVAPGKKVKVPMMHLRDALLSYHADDDWQVLEMPYHGDRLSMVVLLPAQKGRLAQLEKGLTPAKLETLLSRLRLRTGPVAFPKFKFRFRSNLKEDLQAMGMTLPFGAADFSGIFSKGSLNIARVIHEAMISVDERGTEAAAATAVGFNDSESPPFTFRADHPFLFVLRDSRTGSILFMGRVIEP